MGEPERVVVPFIGSDVVAPEVAPRVDDRLETELLDPFDPSADRVAHLRLAPPRGPMLDVDRGRKVHVRDRAGLRGHVAAHLLQQVVGLTEHRLVGSEELVDARIDARAPRLFPVLSEELVLGVEAVGHPHEGELHVVPRDGVPVDVGLPLRNVDALERGAVGTRHIRRRRGVGVFDGFGEPETVTHLRIIGGLRGVVGGEVCGSNEQESGGDRGREHRLRLGCVKTEVEGSRW